MVQVPTVQIIQQNPAIDPSGFRDALNPGNGFLRLLGTAVGEELNFGSIDTTGSGAITDTKLVYARVSNFGDASGVFHMRFFITNSAFTDGFYRFLERKTLHFIPNLILTPAANNTSTVVPTQTNLSGTITEPEYPLGKPWLSGTLDNDVSQYIYLAILADNNVSIGTKGGAGAGSLRYSTIYDFS